MAKPLSAVNPINMGKVVTDKVGRPVYANNDLIDEILKLIGGDRGAAERKYAEIFAKPNESIERMARARELDDAFSNLPPAISDDIAYESVKKPSIIDELVQSVKDTAKVTYPSVDEIVSNVKKPSIDLMKNRGKPISILDEIAGNTSKTSKLAEKAAESVGAGPFDIGGLFSKAGGVAKKAGQTMWKNKGLTGAGLLAGLVGLNMLTNDDEPVAEPQAAPAESKPEAKVEQGVKESPRRGRLGTDNPMLDAIIIKALIENSNKPDDTKLRQRLDREIMTNA